MTFIGRAGSNHLVPMDVGPDSGGDNSATRPLELLLVGLGGCTGIDVVSILNKMRVPLAGLEINIRADRSEEHPRVYTRIEVEYVFSGRDLDREKLQRAVELSQEKYCSVSAMLRKACPVGYSIRTVET
uniref:OsmC family peroxiredoxin n=1 Tax=candidate division WOR-3 bacterium TaxID=2052148 RepID=A0A7C4GBX1_UNCW3